METSLEVHGRVPAVQITPRRRAAVVGLTVLLMIAAVGCGTRRAEQKSAAESRTAESKTGPTKATKAATTTASPRSSARVKTAAARPEVISSGRTNVVRLTQKGCVQLEPHWRSIRVGQSLEWRSDLESSVTIHVTSGAFDKSEFIVRPGGSVSTGPARGPGSYSIWTEPPACQGVPRGVQGAGPGVTVRTTEY
jgi:hypothetical protein